MTHAVINDVLAGKYSVGEQITIRGWIRTRRDSKAGISFLAVHDGSCFDALQAVAPAELNNYESEIKRLTTACSVIVSGTVARSEGQGQAFELQATRIKNNRHPLRLPMRRLEGNRFLTGFPSNRRFLFIRLPSSSDWEQPSY